jgi:pilus assembly protein CpaE
VIRVALAVNDPEVAGKAAALVGEAAELEAVEQVEDLARVPRILARAEPDVLLLHDATGALAAFGRARELSSAFPQVAIVVIAPEITPDLLRTGMQAGARDVLGLPMALEDLEGSVRAAASWARTVREQLTGPTEAAGAGARSGRILLVAGAKGGVGSTTVAIHLALAALGPDREVCLVDFDLATGDVRSFLDLPHRRSVADLVDVAHELSLRHLNETLYTHRSGLKVLLAPAEGERSEDVGVEVARNVLGALRTRFDVVIVDTGASVSDAAAVACELADTAVVVTTPDVPALRGVQRQTGLWDRLQVATADTRVLLNRSSRKTEVQADLVRRVTGRPQLKTRIPADFAALEDAVNTGAPERVEDKKLREAFRRAAEELEVTGPSPAELAAANGDGPKGGLVARLAGERGQVAVETMGVLPILLGLALVLWQVGLLGYTFVLAGHSAREGARALATGEDEARAVRADVPGAWKDGLRCEVGDARVKVSLAVPALVPGLTTPVRVPASAGTTIEDGPTGGPGGGEDAFRVRSKGSDPCQDG